MPFIAVSALASAMLADALEVAPLGGRQRRPGRIAFAVVDDPELVPGERILIVAVDRGLQHLLGLGEIFRILGRHQGMAEHCGDQRHIARSLDGLAQRRDRLLGLAAFQQDLPLQLEEEGVVRILGQQRIGLRLGLLRVAAQVIGVGARIMGRDALVAFRIFFYRLARIDEADELGLDPLETRFERRVARLAPSRVGRSFCSSAWIRSVDRGWERSKLSVE